MKTDLTPWALALALLLVSGQALAQATKGSGGGGAATPLRLSPPQAEGPYYPTEKLADRDNDLTRVGSGAAAQGQVLVLAGRLVDSGGAPISAARVEIWQTDHRGIYMHPGDRGTANRDRNFQFYGETDTDADGHFTFRTILPGVYGSRPRHLHVKVIPRQGPSLTTQLYFRGDERLAQDGIVRRLGADLASLLLDPEPRDANEFTARISLVMARN